MNKPKATIIGAGVSGLTTGIRLAEEGYAVEIFAKEDPQDTTSATAAAFWEPYIVEPADKAAKWGEVSYGVFEQLESELGAEIGVERRRLLSVFYERPEKPEWAKVVPSFRRMTRSQLTEAFEGNLPEEFKHGFGFDTWMIEMPKYLAYLRQRFEAHGLIAKQEIETVQQAARNADLVVNCSGLGSRDIEGIRDKTVYPVAGQVVQVPRSSEKTIMFDTEGVTYMVPRGDNLILGGTADENLYDRTPVAATTADIVRRCSAFLPHLREDDIQAEKVGLRPARPSVRLESETLYGGKQLIHNYGHGGAGVTLSWGCAEDVVGLLKVRV